LVFVIRCSEGDVRVDIEGIRWVKENIPGNISWMLGRETFGDGGGSMAEAEARVDPVCVCDEEAGAKR
jgi:hypothetical protein